MSKEKEYLKKIIKYRISYSGTKETDIIYKKIISEKIRYLSLDELKLLSNIFKELSDVDIFNMLTNQSQVPKKYLNLINKIIDD